ncbi:glycosyltransferase [Glaciecola petra]|uniref:Glycosyl transferase family 28 C-terminal domain-containing protein n=1 Tax=Glaciecola petra TaxID=3075602 RepID=A0ABU2ZR51_9ALTE|nr:hypothetical protein [Aestuariibacter sp. P117]MDT0594731.1 hypothetical protein [Aestuariibacter sp. P117]
MQKHIVLTWELGAGYGHIMGFTPLINVWLERGYKVSLISRNTVTAGNLLRDHPVSILQAPLYSREVANKVDLTLTYADIIYNLGYARTQDLVSLSNAWINLFSLIKPDLIIADHSPSAVLAARCLDIKTVTYGTGFCIPPDVSPMPTFQVVTAAQQADCNEREQKTLQNLNTVLGSHKKESLERVSQLFSASLNFICSLPEVDHYGKVRTLPAEEYAGPRFDAQKGVKADFPKHKTKKNIFAYIKENAPNFHALLNALIESKQICIMHVPDPSHAVVNLCAKHPHLHLYSDPVQVEHVLKNADMAICHGGHGLVLAGLLAGKPMLLLPTQLEQSLLTKRLSEQKICAAINPRDTKANYLAGIRFTIENPILRENVQNFAKKYSQLSNESAMSIIVDKCESFIV